MLYNRIDISKGIDPTKSNRSTERMSCYYWSFKYGFKFQDYACKGWLDLTMLCLNISNIIIKILMCVLLITLANLKQLIY